MKKLLRSAGLFANNERMSPHTITKRAHYPYYGEDNLEVASNHTHWDTLFNSGILERIRKEHKERVARYARVSTLLMDHM